MKIRYSAVLLLVLAATAQAQVYKWVDASGRVVFTDTPPPSNVKSQAMKIKPGSSAPVADKTQESAKPADATQGKTPLTENQSAQKQKDQEEALKHAQEAEKAAQNKVKELNCQSARSRLNSLSNQGKVKMTDAKGNTSYVSDANRAAETAAAQKDVNTWCN